MTSSMACLIRDLIGDFDSTNTLVPVPYVPLTARPVDVIFVSVGGILRQESPNTPRSTTTDINGQFSFTLPWPSEQDDPAVKWLLTLPTLSSWLGTVPQGIAGPLTIHDLEATYGWTPVG